MMMMMMMMMMIMTMTTTIVNDDSYTAQLCQVSPITKICTLQRSDDLPRQLDLLLTYVYT